MKHTEEHTEEHAGEYPGYTCSLCGHPSTPVFSETVMGKYLIEYCQCNNCNYIEAANQLLIELMRDEFRKYDSQSPIGSSQLAEERGKATPEAKSEVEPKPEAEQKEHIDSCQLPIAHSSPAPSHLFGIALFHGIGDILCSTPVARQLKQDYPNCYIVFYTSERFKFAVENNPYIDEIVPLPGIPKELDEKVDALKRERAWTKFYTPAPYMNYTQEPGADLYELTKASAGMDFTVPYQPVMQLTTMEVEEARAYWKLLEERYTPPSKKILVETEFQSDQSPWDEHFTLKMIESLRHLHPVFVFTAKNKPAWFDAVKNTYNAIEWCALPFRHNAELFNLCDAFIGVSSGISCLAHSTWCRNDIPRIEVVHGTHWSTWRYTHHTKRRFCFDAPKFEVALQWLEKVLQGKITGEEAAENTLISLFTTKKEGKYHEISPTFLPLAYGREQRLRTMLLALNEIEPFVLLWGGIGDALLALSRIADESQNITVVAVPNSAPAMKALLDCFPTVTKVYMLPAPLDYQMGMYMRMVAARTKTCLGMGITPAGNEAELWNERLDIFRDCAVKEHPSWAHTICTQKLQDNNHYQLVLAPRGSMHGVFRSKRNVINPRYWKALLEFFRINNIRPILIGTPNEAAYYPADENCIDKRSYDIHEQMQLIAGADILIGADSWHKTFAALAGVRSIVFAPLTGHDLQFVKDTSHFAFIDPWKDISLVQTLDEALALFARIYQQQRGIQVTSSSAHLEHRVQELPRRAIMQQCLSSLHPIFWERRYSSIQTLLVRCSTALGDSLMLTNVLHVLKEQHPHLHLYVSGSAVTEMVMRYNHDVERFVERNSPEEFAIESVVDDVIEYNHIIDQLPEYYNGLHFMDILGNIAGIKLSDRNLYFTVTDNERNYATMVYQRFFGIKGRAFSDSLTVGLHLYTEKDQDRSYIYASLLIDILRQTYPSLHIINFGANALQKNPAGILDCPKHGIGLREQIALVQQCDAFISIDSAFYHIAHNLMRKPTLLIQSVTNEALIGNPVLGLTRPIRNNDANCKACYWASSCKKDCLRSLHPSFIAQAFVEMIRDYTAGKTPLWTPVYQGDMDISWDDKQQHLFTQLMNNRSSGNTYRISIRADKDALPYYASRWNGVWLANDNSLYAQSIQRTPLQQPQGGAFSIASTPPSSLSDAFRRIQTNT